MPSWNQEFIDQFLRVNAAALANGWLDPNSRASIVADMAQFVQDYTAYTGEGYVLRPAAEVSADERVVLGLPATDPDGSYFAILRAEAGNTAYLLGVEFNGGVVTLKAYAIVAGAIGATVFQQAVAGFAAGDACSIDAQVTGASPATLTVTLTDTATNAAVGTASGTDSTAGLQVAGQVGFMVNSAVAGKVTSFTSYTPAATGTGTTPTLSLITLAPTSTTGTKQFGVVATYSDGSTATVTTQAALVLNPTTLGTVAATGLYTAAAATASIQAGTLAATFGGKTATAAITLAAATSAPASVALAVSGPGHWCSPLNWDDDGTGNKLASGVRAGSTTIWTANNGAEGRFSWVDPIGNLATLGIDTSSLAGGSIPAASYPMVKFRINDGAYHVAQVQPGTAGAWALDVSVAGVSGPGTYTLRYVLMASSQAQPRWTPTAGVVPPNSLKVTGLTVAAGSTPVAPAVLGKTLVVFGDSITEGVEAQGTNSGDLVSNDSTAVYARALAASLGAELAAVGFGSQGWERSGGGAVPPFKSAFPFYSAGRPRDFTPVVDYALVLHGTNDGLNNIADNLVTADAQAWLAAARAAFGTATRIFLGIPAGGFKRAALTAAAAAYQATTPDAKAHLVDGGTALQAGLTAFVVGGTWAAPGDGIHPDAPTHARIAATLDRQIALAIADETTPVTVPSSGTTLTAAQIFEAVWGNATSRTLTGDGLDNIVIEPGINLRQALSPILADAGGAILGDGAATGQGDVQVMGGSTTTTPGPVRITATMSGGQRSGVVLNIPA